MSDQLRLLVADDDDRVRMAFRSFFGNQPGLVLVGEGRTGREAIELYEQTQPDVVLMDLHMPELTGIEATAQICARWPTACVVAMTAFSTREYVVAALRAGAAGYLVKDCGAEALVSGIRQAHLGEMPLSGAVRRELVATLAADPRAPSVKLTPREQEVLQWLVHGMTNQQIAAKMFLSEGSVKQYLSHIGDKLSARSRTQIIVRAIHLRLVDPLSVGL